MAVATIVLNVEVVDTSNLYEIEVTGPVRPALLTVNVGRSD